MKNSRYITPKSEFPNKPPKLDDELLYMLGVGGSGIVAIVSAFFGLYVVSTVSGLILLALIFFSK